MNGLLAYFHERALDRKARLCAPTEPLPTGGGREMTILDALGIGCAVVSVLSIIHLLMNLGWIR